MPPQQASSVLRQFEQELSALESASQLRQLETLQGINLCSNDYLGLSADPRLKQAVIAAFAQGAAAGSTGSRLLSGNADVWEELESDLAHFVGSEAALYFGSGYAANVGLLASIARPEDFVFSDSANHASIIDGIRLSGARKVIFPHLDLDSLENALREQCPGAARKFVVVESVFSMDGDRAPISELVALAERYGAELIVDEAHATGVFGPQGRGLVAAAGVTERVLATVHPCGKAFAGMGAFVCGSETLKRFLINRARTFIFSTALPPYLAAQIHAAVVVIRDADAPRQRLASKAQLLRNRLREAGFDTLRSDSQIIPVVLGANERAVRFAARLAEAGFAARAIRPPTVPEGAARLRLSLNVGLSVEMLTRLAEELIRIREQSTALASTAG
jgi:8-amino-7-oxononanoate synthase